MRIQGWQVHLRVHRGGVDAEVEGAVKLSELRLEMLARWVAVNESVQISTKKNYPGILADKTLILLMISACVCVCVCLSLSVCMHYVPVEQCAHKSAYLIL